MWIFIHHFSQETNVIFPLRVYETFAGIGAQHKALTNIDKSRKYFKVVQTSEWDAMTIIAYAQIHNKVRFDKKLRIIRKWDENKINKYFLDKTFSLNSKKPSTITRKNNEFKTTLIAANEVNNNFPDITKVSGELLRNIDLVTYSFPCQGLSIANMGRGEGIKENSQSTSNLIWQIYRILEEAKNKKIELPKYLLMENVKNLISKKHKPDFERWLKQLKSYGYETYYFTLNGLQHRSIQRRERLFAISIKDHEKKWKNEELKKIIEEYGRELSVEERENKYKEIMNSSNKYQDEMIIATPKNTDSRKKMKKENHDLDISKRKWVKNYEYTFNTLTTKQDRHPNIGMVKLPKKLIRKDYLDYRFITNREAYQIMGFKSSDFTKIKSQYKNGHITKEALYRQAGNSIVVSVIQDIFRFIKDLERGVYE